MDEELQHAYTLVLDDLKRRQEAAQVAVWEARRDYSVAPDAERARLQRAWREADGRLVGLREAIIVLGRRVGDAAGVSSADK